jgi:hypothetical protein
MPTKRRRRTRGRLRLPLSLELIDLLLDGRARSHEEAEKLEAEGINYDVFVQFDQHDYPALWRTHRVELLAEWRRRGGQGEPWAAQFDHALQHGHSASKLTRL